MNNIFARLFCSKNHSTSDEAYNIVESMAKAKPLYKELIKQAHPDKHPNNKDVAEELTAITTVQRNYPIGSVDLNRNHSSDVLV